ncbi:MAG: hypothetical protein ACKV2V_24320 [Blastocatellia bacterium]
MNRLYTGKFAQRTLFVMALLLIAHAARPFTARDVVRQLFRTAQAYSFVLPGAAVCTIERADYLAAVLDGDFQGLSWRDTGYTMELASAGTDVNPEHDAATAGTRKPCPYGVQRPAPKSKRVILPRPAETMARRVIPRPDVRAPRMNDVPSALSGGGAAPVPGVSGFVSTEAFSHPPAASRSQRPEQHDQDELPPMVLSVPDEAEPADDGNWRVVPAPARAGECENVLPAPKTPLIPSPLSVVPREISLRRPIEAGQQVILITNTAQSAARAYTLRCTQVENGRCVRFRLEQTETREERTLKC